MTVLKDLRNWFLIDETAQRLSSLDCKEVTAADVFRLCLDGHLTLSVRFLGGTRARPGCRLPTDEQVAEIMMYQHQITQIHAKTTGRSTGECVFLPPHRTTVLADDFALPSEDAETDDVGLIIEKNVVTVVGILDLLLLSDGRNIVEELCQQLTRGPAVVRNFVKGVYLEGEDGTIYQLQEPFDEKVVEARYQGIADRLRQEADDNNMNRRQAQEHMRHLHAHRNAYREMRRKTTTMQNYMPAGSLPNDAVFVIRAAVLRAFESSVLKSTNEIAPCSSVRAIDAMPQADAAPHNVEKALPVSSPMVQPASAVAVVTGPDTALTEGTAETFAGLSKRERQVMVIEAVARQLGYPALHIPTGGKSLIQEECRRRATDLFGGGKHPFLDAWKVAVEQRRVRMAKHDQYARRVG